MRTTRFLALCGLSAVVLYVFTTAAGSLLDPSYSQVRQHVSDLTASGSPTRDRLVAPYLFYNALVAMFAIGLYVESTRGLLFKLGLGALLLNSLAGVMMVTVFPEDLGGSPVTVAGTGHLVFAGVSVLCTVAIAFLYGFAFRRTSARLSGISFAIGAGVLVFGPAAAVATAAGSDLAGLAERVPIGLFLGWVLTVSAYTFVASNQATGSWVGTAPPRGRVRNF
jgi:hypothetical protein